MTSSLPPHLLRAPGSRPGDPRRGGVEQPAQPIEQPQQQPAHPRVPQRLTVTAGEPGTYGDAELAPAERPRNVTELTAAARPAGPEPWPAGSYVLVGTSGKRAHWTGTEWKGGASPGYPAASNRSEPEQSDAGKPQQ